jgi:hypothetical protein
MKINGLTKRQRTLLEWTKRMGMEPVESIEARDRSYEEAMRKVERYAHSARLDEFDYLDMSPPIRHG